MRILFIPLVAVLAFAQAGLNKHFVDDIRTMAYSNYEQVKAGKKPKSLPKILEGIMELAKKHGITQTYDMDGVERYFEKQGKCLFVGRFAYGATKQTNVILADLVKKENKRIKIDGSEINYQIIMLENLTINSLQHFLTEGKHDYTTWIMGYKVLHNIGRIILAGKGVWDILDAGKGSSAWGNTHYELLKAEWQDEYKKSLKASKSKKEAREMFARECAYRVAEDDTLHEIYHAIVRKTKEDTDNADEDVRANYFKYIHGELEHDNLIDFFRGLQYPENSYAREVTEIMIQDFVGYIREQQRRRKFKNISVDGDSPEKQIKDFYKLSRRQIRAIAEELFERRKAALKEK